MNRERDIERVLETWLVDGSSAMPDRLFQAVFDQVERVPQRRLSRLTLRFTDMTPRIRLFTALAAALVVVLVGAYAVSRIPSNVVGPPQSPTAAPTPTPATIPSGLSEMWMGGAHALPGKAAGVGVALVFSGSDDFWMRQAAGNSAHLLESTAVFLGADQLQLWTDEDVANCSARSVGLYTWSLSPSGRILTLDPAGNDACADRGAAVPGTYWLMDCPTADDSCLGPLDAGTYSSQFFDPYVGRGAPWEPRFDALSYTVPDGWINVSDFPDDFVLKPANAPGEARVILNNDIVVANQAELCSEVRDQTIGTTAEEITTYLATAPGILVTAPEAVSIGGLDGFRVDVRLDPAWTQPCPWSEGRPVRMLFADRDAAEGFSWAMEPGLENRIYFLDVVDGRTLMIDVGTREPADFDAFVTQVTPVIESFVFTP